MFSFNAGRLPDFLIIGAQKAGTTWLRALLRQHPDVYMPGREIHFFNNKRNYRRGVDWYKRRFLLAGSATHVGEKTPGYMWTNADAVSTDLPNSHRRVAEVLPDVKLIAIIRNPVDRAISAYNHHLTRGRIPPRLSMDRLLFGDHTDLCRRHGILSTGIYEQQLRDYLEIFDRDQLLVLTFEKDVVENPERGIQKTCSFLDLALNFAPDAPSKARHVHSFSKARAHLNYWLPIPFALTWPVDLISTPWKRSAPAAVRDRLRNFYAPHNERLYTLLGRRIEQWG